jgi:hypothetical protein
VHCARLAAKHDAAAVLERVLGSQACARLDELHLEHAEPDTIACLLRIASDTEHPAHAVLAGLSGLVLESWRRVELGPVLDALPKLERLTCRAPSIGGGHHRPRAELRALTLSLGADLKHRGRTRLFSALNADALPGLHALTLEIGCYWGRRPLPFEQLSLPPGVHVTIRGNLRESGLDALLNWAAREELGTLEIADAQPPAIEHHVIVRAQRLRGMRLLGMQERPDRATLNLRPWQTMVLLGTPRSRLMIG